MAKEFKMTDADIEPIVSRMKVHIETKKSIRVKWAYREYFSYISNEKIEEIVDPPTSSVEKIKAAIVEDGKYIETPCIANGDYFISLNPLYQLVQSVVNANNSSVETNRSLVATNNETKKLYKDVLPKNFEDQKTFGDNSLILGVITAGFILVTIVLSIVDRTPQLIRDMRKELRRQDSTLRNIDTSLRRLDSSIQNVVTDTFLIKKKRR